MVRELRGCFDFFWEEWNKDPQSPTYGMTNGDYVGMNKYSPLSIEEQGFYFTAIISWSGTRMDYAGGRQSRILLTLQTLSKLKRIRGFWYHFIDQDSGKRGWRDSKNVELSNASTGTLLLGALAASEYFGGEIKSLTQRMYSEVDWKWFINPKTKHPYLACYPEDLPSKIPSGITEEGMFEAGRLMPNTFFFTCLRPVLRTPIIRRELIPIMPCELRKGGTRERNLSFVVPVPRSLINGRMQLHRFSQPS